MTKLQIFDPKAISDAPCRRSFPAIRFHFPVGMPHSKGRVTLMYCAVCSCVDIALAADWAKHEGSGSGIVDEWDRKGGEAWEYATA